MKKILPLVWLAAGAFAQSLTDPPPILQIVRKPGFATAAVRPYADARATVNVVGMSAITGLPETWFLESHPNFTSLEVLDKALNAVGAPRAAGPLPDGGQDDILAPARTMIALYQPNYSYRPDQAARLLSRARYMQVSVYRVRGGTESDFSNLVNLRRANLDSINLDRPDMAYEVVSGAPSGTYIFLSPIASLRSMDEGIPNTPVYAQNLADARAKAKASSSPADIAREHLLFRLEPRLSYVSDDFASADTAFWRGR
jgi:hypothetical protein